MITVRFAGLDVHAETIAAEVAEADGEARFMGHDPQAQHRLHSPYGRLLAQFSTR
jgi:hypothetical protein